jgi:hypothetical protein
MKLFFKLQHCFTTSGVQVLEKKWDSKKKLILHVVQKWELQQGITKYWPKFYCNHNIYMATRFMKMFSSSEHSHIINKYYKLNVYGLTDGHERPTRQLSYFNKYLQMSSRTMTNESVWNLYKNIKDQCPLYLFSLKLYF